MPEAVQSKLTAKRPWMLRSARRLFASLFLLLAIPTLILTALTAYFVTKELSEQAIKQNSVTARLVSKHLEEEFFGLSQYLQSFATRRRIIDSLKSNDAAALQEQVSQAVEQNSKISKAVLVDTNGVLLFDYPMDPSALGKNFSYRDWFKGAARSEGPYVSEVYQRVALGQAVVVMIATKIKDADGTVLGYLGTQYAVKDLMQWLESVRTSKSERIALFDHHGQQVLRVNAAAYKNISEHPEIRKLLKVAGGSRRVDDLDGLGRCIVSHEPVGNVDWTVFAYQDEGAVYAPVKRLLGMILVFFLIALAALGGLGWLWQRTLYRYAEDLRRSNKELERFCYSIAHDLLAPVRAMQGFSSVIVEEYDEKLDRTGKEYLHRLSAAAQRMDRLIRDLLQYGQTAHANLAFEEVDLEEAVKEAVANVSIAAEARGARIDVRKPLGRVSADRTVLVHVLEQILGNAIKYVAEGVKPDIEVSSECAAKSIKVWVKDNGIGIEKDQQARIFGVFQRLHRNERYSGTGIGLAIVSKGVERLGGKVGVESELGKGSAFWIEVPTS